MGGLVITFTPTLSTPHYLSLSPPLLQTDTCTHTISPISDMRKTSYFYGPTDLLSGHCLDGYHLQ